MSGQLQGLWSGEAVVQASQGCWQPEHHSLTLMALCEVVWGLAGWQAGLQLPPSPLRVQSLEATSLLPVLEPGSWLWV